MQIDLRLTVTDSPVGSTPIKIRCRNPKHNDSKASCAVYEDGIHCFGCGLTIPANSPQALQFLLGHVPEDLTPFQSDTRTVHLKMGKQDSEADPLFYAIADVFHKFLVEGRRRNRLHWLHERGLSLSTIYLFKLGHDGARFSIPIYDRKGQLVSIRYRRDDFYGTLDWKEDDLEKYTSHPGRDNSMHLYPEWLLNGKDEPFFGTDYVVVTEGEFDAMLLIQNDIPAITMTNGAGRIKHIPELLAEHYPHIKKVFGATDMDLVGGTAAAELGHYCLFHGLEYEALTWPNEYKDVTELYQAGGWIADMVDHLEVRLPEGATA